MSGEGPAAVNAASPAAGAGGAGALGLSFALRRCSSAPPLSPARSNHQWSLHFAGSTKATHAPHKTCKVRCRPASLLRLLRRLLCITSRPGKKCSRDPCIILMSVPLSLGDRVSLPSACAPVRTHQGIPMLDMDCLCTRRVLGLHLQTACTGKPTGLQDYHTVLPQWHFQHEVSIWASLLGGWVQDGSQADVAEGGTHMHQVQLEQVAHARIHERRRPQRPGEQQQ